MRLNPARSWSIVEEKNRKRKLAEPIRAISQVKKAYSQTTKTTTTTLPTTRTSTTLPTPTTTVWKARQEIHYLNFFAALRQMWKKQLGRFRVSHSANKKVKILVFSSQEEEAAARFRRETDFVTKLNKEVKTDPTKNRSSPLTRVKKCAHTINCFVKNRSALCLSLNSVKKEEKEPSSERT